MPGPYREITPEQRADHVDNLYLLGRLVIMLPPPERCKVKRSFVVMSVPTES
ncbi:MAG: hypothetical protein ABIY55_04115 [Kofleriaceae bacterium]